MPKEKFKEYRDELAGKLKEIRSSDEENPEKTHAKAQGYLEAEQNSAQYKAAKLSDAERKKHQQISREKLKELTELNEHAVEWLKEVSNDPESVDSFIEAAKEVAQSGSWPHSPNDARYLNLVYGDEDKGKRLLDIDQYDIKTADEEIERLEKNFDVAFNRLKRSIDLHRLLDSHPRAVKAGKYNLSGEDELSQDILKSIGYHHKLDPNAFLGFMEKFRKTKGVL